MNSQFNNNNDLAAKVSAILNEKKSLKAKKIATALGIDRSEVSSFLHANKELFIQDPETFEWSLVIRIELVINFPEVNWLDSETFESTLIKAGSPLDSKAKKITFVIGKKCNILLESTSRLLTLCNQLVMIGKAVTIDFSACKATLHYLDRAGFCDRLDTAVDVLPLRPAISKAETHRGRNTSLMEFGEINPSNLDPKVALELQKLFIHHAGEQYETLALTIIAEPLNNVQEHSKSPINGFAAFQKYQGNKKHIQTVVSDSGIGIAGSLRPVLEHKYPKLQTKFTPRSMYAPIRRGIIPNNEYVTTENLSKLDDCEFVFICVDKGLARKLISEYLILKNIPFVDVGMELSINTDKSSLIGTCRVTMATPEKSDHCAKHMPMMDDEGDDLYRKNIQVADMNCFNAALAVMKWKQYCHFYQDIFKAHHTTYSVNSHSLTRDEMNGLKTE